MKCYLVYNLPLHCVIFHYQDNDYLSVNQLTLGIHKNVNRAASSVEKWETNTVMPTNG